MGIEAGAPKAVTGRGKKNGKVNFPTPGNRRVGRPAFNSGPPWRWTVKLASALLQNRTIAVPLRSGS